MKKAKIAVFIGRFQPWHVGHTNAFEKILHEHDFVQIVIGSAQESRTQKNPWTAPERAEIIKQTLSAYGGKYDISVLEDVLGDDETWLLNLKKTVGVFDVIYSGNEWLKDICEEFNIPFAWIEYQIDINATKIREMLVRGESVSDFTLVDSLPV